jgi:predicted CXXCH cytochrome family protein
MFRKFAGLAVVACLFIAGTASAQTGITGSVHDFSAELGGDLCAVCHVTHNEVRGVANAPLWDHEVTTTDYVPYTSPTMQSITSATAVTPSGISALCLSCHDGTIAVDSYGGVTNGANFVDTPGVWSRDDVGAGMQDADLSSEHPISMSYAAAGESGTGFQATPLDNVPLFAGNVECASCHDVHNQGTGPTALLINTNVGSELCLDCHIK